MEASLQRVNRRRALIAAALCGMLWSGSGTTAAWAQSWTLAAHVSVDGDLRETGGEYAERIVDAARSGGWTLRLQLSETAGDLVRHAVTDGVVDEAGVPPAASASAAVEDLLRWAQESAPADKYALIIYGHDARSAGSDQEELTFREIDAGIMAGLGRPVDVMVLDRCYGAGVDALWELRSSVDVLVGAPGRRLSTGLAWQKVIGEVPASSGMSAADFALRCAEVEGTDAMAHMVALRPSESPAIAKALRGLVEAVEPEMAAVAPLLTLVRGQAAGQGGDAKMVDLVDLCNGLSLVADGEVRTAALATVTAVEASFLRSGEARRCGPSISFGPGPVGGVQPAADRDSFAEASGWLELTESYRSRLRELINRPAGDAKEQAA